MVRLYGRRNLLRQLTDSLMAGHTVLLYGPMGSGKSALLDALARRMKKQHRPCGFCCRARSLPDITEALLAAYPVVQREGRTQPQLRGDLVHAVEARPGVLLLDHLGDLGSQFKGYLRTMGETGLWMLLAADAEATRDHDRLRAMHLSFRETEAPRLPSRNLHQILNETLKAGPPPFNLTNTDRSALIRLARGRPGWAIWAGRMLREIHFWRHGRVLLGSVHLGIMMQILNRYLTATPETRCKDHNTPN